MVRILIGVLAAVVVAAGVGSWASTRSDAPARFEACHVDRGVITLDYLAGAGDRVTTSADPQEDVIVVSLDLRSPSSGARPAIGLPGTFTFAPFGGLRDRPLRYPDGTPLRCR
jgi:hypothetical protein